MIRRTFAILALAAFAAQAQANPIVDHVTQQLIDQGYDRVEVSRTFLGRIRIEATGKGAEREVIVNPRTGQVLRDHWEDEKDEGDHRTIAPTWDDDDDRDDDKGDWKDMDDDPDSDLEGDLEGDLDGDLDDDRDWDDDGDADDFDDDDGGDDDDDGGDDDY
ncbi:hypothetical protein [Thalassobius sp. Cn5-15]|uniref:hypothetical protein n=1 Tax=Thalassobius sp. Cn5-15 TaxID=2917763 RepID=UPI001EF3267B|nr:hypothetical protein [Thalassobius sp. Cn5-15]MCG7493322.1 hypothetical protein [Thalassobius sp. Cn5-15]